MSILRRTVLAGILTCAFALAQSPAESEVRKAEDSWAAAVKAVDRAALANIMSDDLVYTHSTGVSESKTQYLDKLKSGAQKYADLQYSNMKVRSWQGNAAVVNAQLRMTGSTNNVPFDKVANVADPGTGCTLPA